MRFLLAVWMAMHALFVSLPALADPFAPKVITGDDYPPWTDQGLPHGGIAAWLVVRAFEEGGLPIGELQWMPWKRGFEETKAGNSDGAFPWIKNPEREEVFLFTESFLPSIEYAWTWVDSGFQPALKDDLRDRVYCRPLGYGEFGFIKERWIHISSAMLRFSRKASAGVLNPRHFLGVELIAQVSSSMSACV